MKQLQLHPDIDKDPIQKFFELAIVHNLSDYQKVNQNKSEVFKEGSIF